MFGLVDSQSLTGIAHLHRLRNDPKLAVVSAVWPFETGWATKAKWLRKHVSILHAEIYPSVRDPMADKITDRGQVRAMWQWARDLDRDNLLWREFCRPIEVETGSKEDLAIQLTEGWILGCSPTITNQQCASGGTQLAVRTPRARIQAGSVTKTRHSLHS
jgi:precorrin-8X/cobalt-precorrin-8 methylmutase